MTQIMRADDNPDSEGVVIIDPRKCGNCSAWRPKKNQTQVIFGGCARGGQITTHYGDAMYNHYTTDTSCCSAWETK